jgi:hypothetical protein
MTWHDHDGRRADPEASFAVLFGLLARMHGAVAAITDVTVG